MHKIECNEIEWDTDGDEEVLKYLPRTVIVDLHDVEWLEDNDTFEITEENSSDIADYLSGQYGFYVFTFQYRTL
jgi:hypothetical protein